MFNTFGTQLKTKLKTKKIPKESMLVDLPPKSSIKAAVAVTRKAHTTLPLHLTGRKGNLFAEGSSGKQAASARAVSRLASYHRAIDLIDSWTEGGTGEVT